MKTKPQTKSSPKRQLVPDIIIVIVCLAPQHSPAPSHWVETTCTKIYLENSLVTAQVNCGMNTDQS